MNEEIFEILRKKLPEMELSALKDELKKADLVPELLTKTAAQEESIKQADRTISELRSKISSEKDLEARERALKEKERLLEIELLKHSVACEKQKFEAVRDLAYSAFRNPTVHKNFNRSAVVPNGSYPQSICESESTTQD